jgi:hypothetical protein
LPQAYPKRLLDQQRVFAEITVLRQSDFRFELSARFSDLYWQSRLCTMRKPAVTLIS